VQVRGENGEKEKRKERGREREREEDVWSKRKGRKGREKRIEEKIRGHVSF
jgi:hypothetical protein